MTRQGRDRTVSRWNVNKYTRRTKLMGTERGNFDHVINPILTAKLTGTCMHHIV